MGLVEQLWSAVGTRALSDWGLFQLTAVVAATGWFFARTPGALRRLRPCLIVAFAGAVVGAFALEPLVGLPAWFAAGMPRAPPHPGRITAYGALAGMVGAYALLAPHAGVRRAVALDLLAPSLGLMIFFARLGCFGAGCDFGDRADVPWAVRYGPDTPAFGLHRDLGWIPADAPHALPVHPVQLYEAAVGAAMCLAAVLVERRQRAAREPWPEGAGFAVVAVTYAAGRSLVELFRGDAERGGVGWFSTAQWLGVAVIAAAVVWATRARPALER